MEKLLSDWKDLDALDKTFVYWAFALQLMLILHFAIRKPLMESYTERYGWIVYALGIPAALISLQLLRSGKGVSFWMAGFLFLIFSAFGYWIDYVKQIPFRSPLVPSLVYPYAALYLASIMFYWWPLGALSRPLWYIYAVLFVISTLLNVFSH
jgi:hypothetical protein